MTDTELAQIDADYRSVDTSRLAAKIGNGGHLVGGERVMTLQAGARDMAALARGPIIVLQLLADLRRLRAALAKCECPACKGHARYKVGCWTCAGSGLHPAARAALAAVRGART
jgi:hypothetical protein